MAESGSETRQRQARYTVRFSALENAVIRAHAAAAGVGVATYLRCAALNTEPSRAARRPTSNHEACSRLMAEMGQLNTAFRSAAALLDPMAAETAVLQLLEYRLILFEAMGRKP